MIETLVRSSGWRLRARRASPAAAWALAGWLAASALGAGAAEAPRLVDVRVGRHPGFVRVVFETDAPAAFVVERGRPGESRVRIEAGGVPGVVSVPPGAGAEVILESLPGGGTLARIRAAAPVRIESQVLDRPPRIVFDLRRSAGERAAGAEEPPAAPPEPAVAPPALTPEIEKPAILSDLAPPLAESPELELPVAQPPASAETPPVAEPAPEPVPEPALPSEPAVPPVSAAPPAALAPPGLDDRSLLLGAAGGLALGLGIALLARGRGPIPPIEVEVVEEAPERAAALAPAENEPRPPLRMAPWPESEPLAADLLVMFQRLDERCAGAEQRLAALVDRTDRLERRNGAEADELVAQRVALARLDLALGRPLAKAEPARPLEPPAASTTPPRQS